MCCWFWYLHTVSWYTWLFGYSCIEAVYNQYIAVGYRQHEFTTSGMDVSSLTEPRNKFCEQLLSTFKSCLCRGWRNCLCCAVLDFRCLHLVAWGPWRVFAFLIRSEIMSIDLLLIYISSSGTGIAWFILGLPQPHCMKHLDTNCDSYHLYHSLWCPHKVLNLLCRFLCARFSRWMDKNWFAKRCILPVNFSLSGLYGGLSSKLWSDVVA